MSTDLTMSIQGHQIPVYVIPETDKDVSDQGRFAAEIHGERMTDPTWGGLRAKLSALTQGETAVPFVLVRDDPRDVTPDRPHLRAGTARGIHANQQRRVLVTWASGQKGAVEYATTVHPLPHETADELEELLTHRSQLNIRIKEILEAHHLDLPEAVKEARAARLGEQR